MPADPGYWKGHADRTGHRGHSRAGAGGPRGRPVRRVRRLPRQGERSLERRQRHPAAPLRPRGPLQAAARRRLAAPGGTLAVRVTAMVPRRVHGWDAAVLLAANAVAVTGLWWREGGLREVHDAAGALTSLGRLTGLLGALLSLAMLLLLARVP